MKDGKKKKKGREKNGRVTEREDRGRMGRKAERKKEKKRWGGKVIDDGKVGKYIKKRGMRQGGGRKGRGKKRNKKRNR